MDVSTQIAKFEEFIEKNYYEQLLERNRLGNNFLTVDFSDLVGYDPELAELLLEEPTEVTKACEMAIKNFDLFSKVKGRFYVRFMNLPRSQQLDIRNIRSSHIGKLIVLEGLVRQKSDVRPQATSARFECPSCGNIITVVQIEATFKEPTMCGCGRKGKFRLLSKELVDAQKLVLEEAPDQLEGSSEMKRMDIFLRNDLVSPLSEKKTNPGTKIKVVGEVIEVPIPSRDGGKLVRFDLMVEANHIEPLEEDFSEITISKEEQDEIEKIASDPNALQMLIESLAPSIYGHEKIKEAVIYQLLGGVQKQRTDGAVQRGDIHILLIGDPGAGKSQLIKRVSKVAPKSRYVSGKGASGAGLTAAVVHDEFMKGWTLEAGALVLAHKGFCFIDEMDKMSNEDRSAMHEALEQQTVTIAKANIQAQLRCETTVLAAANPKWGRFDPYEMIVKQIDLPPALMSRFDLIFPIRDLPSVEGDTKLATFILDIHKTQDIGDVPIGTNLLKKYISYARMNAHPKMTDGAIDQIRKYYVSLRNSGSTEDGGPRSVTITARQLEALVRLSEASAKVSLKKIVDVDDAQKAIDVLHHCMLQTGVDPETGNIDMDVISTGVSSSARSHVAIVKETIKELENKIGKVIPFDDIVAEAQKKGVDADKIEEIIEQLKRKGDVFEPRNGFIQRM